MINAVIIEDDPMLAKHLSMLVEEHCPEVRILTSVNSGKAALEVLPGLSFDLVFSDIQLGDMDAFRLFELLDNSHHHIIFTTAHDEFALHAFKIEAVDYFIKPIVPNDLKRAVNRALKHIYDRIPPLEVALVQKSGKLLFKSTDSLHFILPARIIYCEAYGAYTKLFLEDNPGDFKLVTMHLKKIEALLPPNFFFRIHDAHIVNINFIDHIKYQKRMCILNHTTSSGQTQLKIAERKYLSFIDFLKKG